MPRRRLRIFCIFCLLVVRIDSAGAGVETIAVTGGDVGGISDARYADVSGGTLGDSGDVVFAASLELGAGGVVVGTEEGVWLATTSESDAALLARTGVGNVPDIVGANFQSFGDLAIDALGNVGLRAQLASGGGSDQGWWQYTNGANTLVARTGSGNVPGVASADFAVLPLALRMASNQNSVLNGTLSFGPDVSTENDKAIWSYDGAIGTLVVREGISPVPGMGAATFKNFVTPAINQNNQLAFSGTTNVAASNDFGVWRYTGTTGTLIAREGVGNVPGVVGASFSSFQEPTINSSGQMAWIATLLGAGADDQGVWRYDGTTGTLLAQKGITPVPELPGANFVEFSSALLNDNNDVLLSAALEIGPGGVGAGNDWGLWLLGDSDRLIARTDSGDVPEVADANFLDFTTTALNANGDVALAATLEIGSGDVTANNDTGIWVIDNTGAGLLIARKGDALAGRIIASLDFLGGSGGGDSRPQGFNAAGQLALDVMFTNGDSGLFLYTPDPLFTADFDDDNDVDGQDLTRWQESFGLNDWADADADNDSDGADFLLWQKQFGSGTATSAASLAPASLLVPEPGTSTLLLLYTITLLLHTRPLQRKSALR